MVMTDQAWYIVRNTPGVTGFLGSHGQGSKPTPLLPEEAEQILHQLGMSARHTELDVEVMNKLPSSMALSLAFW